MIIKLNELIEEACYYVSVRRDGSLIYDMSFCRKWEESGGDFGLLVRIIEDNADDSGIDWIVVRSAFREWPVCAKEDGR